MRVVDDTSERGRVKLSWALGTDQPTAAAFWADDQGLRHEHRPSHRHQAARPDDAINRGTHDVSDAFAPALVWRIVGNHLLTGEYHGLESWRALMRERSQLTGGTYCPQPQAWLGSDRHVFCSLTLTAQRGDGREIDTSHVAVSRMSDDGFAHEFWTSAATSTRGALWA